MKKTGGIPNLSARRPHYYLSSIPPVVVKQRSDHVESPPIIFHFNSLPACFLNFNYLSQSAIISPFSRAKMKNLDIITAAVSLIIKAAILASRWSGRARRRSLQKLAAMDADSKDKEILFLRDRVHQLQTQVSVLQKRFKKNGKHRSLLWFPLHATYHSVNAYFFAAWACIRRRPDAGE